MKKEYLKQIFWDTTEEGLDNLSDTQIVNRSISFGTLPVIQNMFDTFDRPKIKSIFLNMNPKTVTSKRFNFFKSLLSN